MESTPRQQRQPRQPRARRRAARPMPTARDASPSTPTARGTSPSASLFRPLNPNERRIVLDPEPVKKAVYDFSHDVVCNPLVKNQWKEPVENLDISTSAFWLEFVELNSLENQLVVLSDQRLPLVESTLILVTSKATEAVIHILYWELRNEFNKDTYVQRRRAVEDPNEAMDELYTRMMDYIRLTIPNIFLCTHALSTRFANFFFTMIGNTIKFKLNFATHFDSDRGVAKTWNHVTTSLRAVTEYHKPDRCKGHPSDYYEAPNYYFWAMFPTSLEMVIHSMFPLTAFFKEISKFSMSKEHTSDSFDDEYHDVEGHITDLIIDSWRPLDGDARPTFDEMRHHPMHSIWKNFEDLFVGNLPNYEDMTPSIVEKEGYSVEDRIEIQRNKYKLLDWERQSTNKQREIDINSRREYSEKKKMNEGKLKRY